jgi:urease gamma subunit
MTAFTAPVMLRRVASGLRIEKVRSVAMIRQSLVRDGKSGARR